MMTTERDASVADTSSGGFDVVIIGAGKSGNKRPWKAGQHYLLDAIGHRFERIDDALVFGTTDGSEL